MFNKAYEIVKSCVLPLRMSTKQLNNKILMGFASGFMINENHLLTVAHSVHHDLEDMTSKLHTYYDYMELQEDNSILYYNMELVDIDNINDIALFKIKGKRPYLIFSNVYPEIGEQLACYGFNHLNYVSEWKSIYIQAMLRTCYVSQRFPSQYVADSIMYPGFSGAPYFNIYGEVVGMQQRILTVPATSEKIDFSLFLDIDTIKTFLAKNKVFV